jgi:hypothetical protein
MHENPRSANRIQFGRWGFGIRRIDGLSFRGWIVRLGIGRLDLLQRKELHDGNRDAV